MIHVTGKAGVHVLVADPNHPDHHWVSARSWFTRGSISYDAPGKATLNFEYGWDVRSCGGCRRLYNPFKDKQIYCSSCGKWFHVDEVEVDNDIEDRRTQVPGHLSLRRRSFQRTPANERTLFFKAGPIIRGQGWIAEHNGEDPLPERYFPFAWLNIGNQALHNYRVFPPSPQQAEALLWFFDSQYRIKAKAPDVLASCYDVVTGITQSWRCQCGRNM